jgi:anti-sigma B factor antagonist
MNAIGIVRDIQPVPGRAHERVLTIVLDGELSLDELNRMGEEMLQLAVRGLRNVVLDFTEVSHLDYRGLRPLVAQAELLRRAGGEIKVSGLSGYLMYIFRVAGVHDAFQFFADPENARASFAEAVRLAG